MCMMKYKAAVSGFDSDTERMRKHPSLEDTQPIDEIDEDRIFRQMPYTPSRPESHVVQAMLLTRPTKYKEERN